MRVRTAAVGGLVEDNPLAAAATTLTSNGLAALPTFAAGDFALVVFDPEARTGEPFAKRMTAHTNGAVTATIDAAAIYGTARQIDRDVPWRLTDIMDQDGNGSGLIMYKEVGTGTTNLAVATTSFADVDATAEFTFTAPPSGAVIASCEGFANASNNCTHYWNLRQGGADVAGTGRRTCYAFTGADCASRVPVSWKLTGLTPGTNYTYRLGHKKSAGNAWTIFDNGVDAGPLIFRVKAFNL